ncbi:MAG: cyanophycin synthetase, partial [Spirochaetales bacterium]|nr:cyanophycin synthetase [Spirochaetales bacterium]
LYTQALGQYSSLFYSCGVCGVHGKTSTTGLVGTILKELDLPVQVLVGSRIKSFGDSCTFTSDLFTDFHNQKSSEKKSVFVAETCEYQRHFMQFEPKNIILTSVESDHEDYYPTFKDIQNAFVDYLCKLPPGGNVIYCADDKGACETVQIVKNERNRHDLNFIPYGVSCDDSCDFKINFGKIQDGASHFKLNLFENNLNNTKCESAAINQNPLDFKIHVPGHHEVLDAAAAVALSCTILKYFGKNPLDYYKQIADGVSKFSGGKRRSEIIKRTKINGNDVIVIDDYGHHPTAVNTTLQGYREFYSDRKIIVDFMSHTYSRTQSLLDEFSKCFSYADEIILHKIYSSARENPEDFEITGKTLFEKVQKNYKNPENVFYFEEVLDAKDFVLNELAKPLEKGKNGYLFVTMGAGDNWKLGQEI